jgi:hypothetical protein
VCRFDSCLSHQVTPRDSVTSPNTSTAEPNAKDSGEKTVGPGMPPLCHRNPSDEVGEALLELAHAWEKNRDAQELRRGLLDVLLALEVRQKGGA